MSTPLRALGSAPENGPVYVAGAGAQCSVGLTLPAVDAAVGGQLNAFRLEPRIRSPRTGARLTCAWLDTFGPADPPAMRMAAMARAAAAEALGDAGAALATTAGVSVLLAAPARRPGFDGRDAAALTRAVIRALPQGLGATRHLVQPLGHAGFFALLVEARARLAAGTADLVLVGGADSYRDPDLLGALDALGCLRTEDEPLGWIPGEGAAFVLLASAAGLARLGGRAPLAVLDAVGLAMEPCPWYAGHATAGDGLTEALHATFGGPYAPPAAVPAAVFCDFNGEGWRTDEWAYAYLRTADHFADPLVMHHPAECWGDVGAASGALLSALAARRLQSGDAGAGRALVWAASGVTPLRGACALSPVSASATPTGRA